MATLERMFQEKEERLQRYLKLWAKLPEQGTEEWLSIRSESVGGSQIFQLNTTEYAVKRLLLNKMGLDVPAFEKIMAVQWGNIFEDMFRKFTERYFSTRIYEASSLKGKFGASSSPDGLGVVLVDVQGYKIPMICLFEFKCLFSRILKKTILDKYYDQVQQGLNVIGPTEIGIYGEALIRCCSLKQLGNNAGINTIIHHKPGNMLNNPLQFGVCYFYLKRMDETTKAILARISQYRDFLKGAEQYSTEGTDLIDLGCDDIFRLLFLMDRSQYRTNVVVYENSEAALEAINGQSDDCFAFLPWKLFRADYTMVEQNREFLNQREHKLREFTKHARQARIIKKEGGTEACRAYISGIRFEHLPFSISKSRNGGGEKK